MILNDLIVIYINSAGAYSGRYVIKDADKIHKQER